MSVTPAQHRYCPQHAKTGHTTAWTTAGLVGLLLPLVLSTGTASADPGTPDATSVIAGSPAAPPQSPETSESPGISAEAPNVETAPAVTDPRVQPAAVDAPMVVARTVAVRTTARKQVGDLRQGTELKISGPLTQAAGHQTIAAGQLFAGAPLQGETVELQIERLDGGWRTITRATTDAHGVARMNYQLGTTTRVRTYFPGDEDRRPTASAAPAVTVAAPPAPAPAPAPVSTLGQRAVANAATHYGKAYRYGATGPSNFDCSGLTGYVYRQLGVNLPRTSGEQERALPRVAFADARAGDLIFTWTGGRVSHVGIYMGGDMMYASTKTGDTTRPQRIWSSNITVGRVA